MSKSPAPQEEELEDRMSIAESPPASSETGFTGDDEGKQNQDDRVTPEVSYATDEVQVRQPSTIDDSPSKIVRGWVVDVSLEEGEESADEGAEEEQAAQGILPADEEVDELEADAGSDEMEDDEDDYERVPKPLEADPETHSDPLFPGDVQSGSDESESADETSDEDDAVDENPDVEDPESESDQIMDDRENILEPHPDQSSLAKGPHFGPPESDSGEESDVVGDDAAPTHAKSILPIGLGGVVRSGSFEKEYEEDSDEEEPEQQADPAEPEDDDGEDHSSSSPAPTSSPVPIGAISKVTGEDESVGDSADDAESDEETEGSDELESPHSRAPGDGEGDEEDQGDDSSEEKNYNANLPQPPTLNESGARVDADVSDEELIGEGGNVVQEQWRKSPSSSASEHGVGLDDEETDEESEWEGVAKGDSESESDVE